MRAARPSTSPPVVFRPVVLRGLCAVTLLAVLLASTAGAPASARAGYDWPLAPRPSVVRSFDPPAQRWLAGHRGVDLAAPAQSAVLAARAGSVVFAGPLAGRPVVSILHPDGLSTTYEPVDPRVRRGEQVVTGQVIGYLVAGHEGCRRAACLHWGARRGTGRLADYLNPLGLLGLLRVRLKPPL